MEQYIAIDLSYGVTVAQLFLEQFVKVRILVRQRYNAEMMKLVNMADFVLNNERIH